MNIFEWSISQRAMTMMIVTHEVNFARQLADSVFFMDEGVVLDHGTPDDVLVSSNQRSTRELLSRVL